MTTDAQDIVEALAKILRDTPGIRLALLFGSAAKNALRSDSDVDVAILFADDLPGAKPLELEARLVRAVGREVDLVRLNDAGTVLRWEIAKNHVLICCEPGPTYVRFLATAGIEHDEMRPLLLETSKLLARRLARRDPPERASS